MDLDYYSSTMEALNILNSNPANWLPRVHCYFDDLVNEYVGGLAATKEFNNLNSERKFAQIFGLSTSSSRPWGGRIFIFHDFNHSRYNDRENPQDDQLPLNI